MPHRHRTKTDEHDRLAAGWLEAARHDAELAWQDAERDLAMADTARDMARDYDRSEG